MDDNLPDALAYGSLALILVLAIIALHLGVPGLVVLSVAAGLVVWAVRYFIEILRW